MAEEKTKAALLKEKLMNHPKTIKKLTAEEIAAADAFCEDYKAFLNASPVEREAVRYTVGLAEKAGFKPYAPDAEYQPGDRVYYTNRGKAIALAVIGKQGVKNGARLAIAHIDSPRIDLKPNPLYEDSGLALFKTHYYGGLKKYQWTAIPLTLHGTVVKLDGTSVDIVWGDGEDESCFCVSDLLPHLAQEQVTKPMAKAFTGEDLNVLIGSRPFAEGTDQDTPHKQEDKSGTTVKRLYQRGRRIGNRERGDPGGTDRERNCEQHPVQGEHPGKDLKHRNIAQGMRTASR